jgi:GNAT superfamily N-acetyltransferase
MIRAATMDDWPAVWSLLVAFHDEAGDYAKWLQLDRERIERLMAEILVQGCVAVADEGNEVVGVIVVALLEHPYNGQPYAEEVVWFVTKAHRDGTIGLKLLRYAEQWARQSGATVLKMVEPEGKPTVGTFLARRGYRRIEAVHVLFLDATTTKETTNMNTT